MNLPLPRTARRVLAVMALAVVVAVSLSSTAGANNFARPFGDVKVLATVPSPNAMPEGIAVRGNRVYVSGPATFGNANNGEPSGVWEFDIATGALTNYFPAQGENLAQDHANSCIAFDGAGRLYVNNIQLGVYRLDPATGAQEIYAPPFPDLPACNAAAPGTPCSPTLTDLPMGSLPNDLTFDAAGNLYVAASYRGRRGVVRITPDGREAGLVVAGMNVVGLCFNSAGDMIVATNEAVFSLPLGVRGTLVK